MASEFNAHEAGSIPSELAILPLQDSVLFPNTVMPLAVTKPYGIKLVEDALKASAPIGVVALKNRDASPPAPDDVYTVGTVAIIQKMIKIPDGTLRCIISGTVPFTATEFTRAEPYLVAKVEPLEEQTTRKRRADGAVAQPRVAIHAPARVPPVGAQRARARSQQHHRSESALVFHRVDDASGHAREAVRARRARYARALAHAHRIPHPRARSPRARSQDPVRHPKGDGQEPARVLLAPAAQGDPRRARRVGPDASRRQRAAREGRSR